MNGFNLFSLLTLFLGLVLGNRLRIETDSAKRRRAFRDFIAGLDDEFDAEWRGVARMDSEDFTKWDIFASQYASVPRFKAEVIKVREDIRWWNQCRFRAACDAYIDYGCETCFETHHAIFARVKNERKEIFKRLSKYAK